MTEGDIVIVGAILFSAYKARLASEWYYIRKRLFWKYVHQWKGKRRGSQKQPVLNRVTLKKVTVRGYAPVTGSATLVKRLAVFLFSNHK